MNRWYFYLTVDPSGETQEVVDLFTQFARDMRLPDCVVKVNPRRYGVLHHPWASFDHLFSNLGVDQVLRAEDDLLVSDDILEMFEWIDNTYSEDTRVASGHSYSGALEGDPRIISKSTRFESLNWCTWRDRWNDFMRDTWDHDYSTFNGVPGRESGWDWNLNTRIYPKFGLQAVRPQLSRTQNIGLQGTHSTPQNFSQSPSFREEYGVVSYAEGR
jgi:hypothetical protein